MQALIETIRTAVADDASPEQKSAGAQACRTILAALAAVPGQPIALTGAPVASPLAALGPDRVLDLLIARLRAALPAEHAPAVAPAVAPPDLSRGPRIAIVSPPPSGK